MRSILSLFLALSFWSVCAQSPIDSLTFKLKESKSSEDQLRFTTLLAKEYAETNPDTALIIAAKALRMADLLNLDSAKGQIFVAISTARSYLAQYDSAMVYSFKALRNAEVYRDTLTLIDANNNIGIDHMFREEDQKAVEYFEKVANLSRQFGDSLRWGHVLNNLGMMAGYAEDTDSELEYYNQAARIFKSIGEIEGLANTKLNAGTAYTVLGEFAKAEELFEQALELFEEIGYSSGIQNTILSWAENALESGALSKAENLANQALEIAEKHALSQDILYTFDLLEQISVSRGDYKKAYGYSEQEAEIKARLFNEEKARQIGELETKYETEKKEAEIERLGLENDLKDANLAKARNAQYAIGIGGGMIILVLAVYYIQRNKKLRAEREAQELQVEALKKRFLELHASPAELAVDLEFQELNEKLHTPLTEREFDALKLSLEGKTNSEIADQLFISVSTVKFHLRNTYSKMGVGNRKEAFQFMLKTS